MKLSVMQRGFAFIELLVAIVLVGVGLLGVSALQVNALKATNAAYLQSIATEQAVAFSERVRTMSGDKLYLYDQDSDNYRLSSAVVVYVASSPSSSTITDSANYSLGSGATGIVAADIASMNAWLQTALPNASAAWSLSLWNNTTSAVLSSAAASACNFSPASSTASAAVCSLKLAIRWRSPQDASTSSGSVVEYLFR